MLVKNVIVVTDRDHFEGYVEFESGVIKKVGKGRTERDGMDGAGSYFLPAFWDLHTHGGYGFSFNELAEFDEKDAKRYLDAIHQEGVCAVLATAVTDSHQRIESIIANYARLKKLDKHGIVRGLYFEGPFISKIKKGAHDPDLMLVPSPSLIEQLLVPDVKIVAITPEADTDLAFEAIAIAAKKTAVTIGHSNATAAQFLKAVDCGATRVTHLFNAMTGFEHRQPGVVNGVFASKGLFIEIIADSVHIDPLVTNETLALLGGQHHFMLVSDSLSLKGLPDGKSKLGPVAIEKRGDFCYVDGLETLAGSCLPYDRLVQRFWNSSRPSLPDLARMSALHPAVSLGIKNEGKVAKGYVASFVLLDPEDMSLRDVFIRGEHLKKH